MPSRDRSRFGAPVRLARACVLALAWSGLASVVAAGTIDTSALERPWPEENVRESEVHKYTIQWRQLLDKEEGLFVGIRFTAPTGRQLTWDLATNYTQIGQMMPGVTSVRYLEDTPTRQVIQIDAKVLWKELQLNFEIERDPPNALRFRLVNDLLGEYRVLLRLMEATDAFHSSEPAVTQIDLSTWLKPPRPVPMRTLAALQRMMFFRSTKAFLKACEQEYLKTQ